MDSSKNRGADGAPEEAGARPEAPAADNAGDERPDAAESPPPLGETELRAALDRLATKEDVDGIKAALSSGIGAIRAPLSSEMGEIRAAMSKEIGAAVRASLSGEMADLKAALSNEAGEIGASVSKDMARVKDMIARKEASQLRWLLAVLIVSTICLATATVAMLLVMHKLQLFGA